MTNSGQRTDKTVVLDNCVDGDETRFNNLVGIHYGEFNLIYNIIKQNQGLLTDDGIQCVYLDECTLEVTIPAKTSNLDQLTISHNDAMTYTVTEESLVLNITVKKEW